MNIKKIIALVMGAALAVSCSFVLAGCSSDPTQAIRESLTQQFDAYKNMDDAALSELATLAEDEELDKLGIDNQEFATAVLDGFDYSIEDITIDGNNATATVTIVSKSYADFANKVKAIVDEISDDPTLNTSDQEQIAELLGQRVMQAFDDVQINTEVATIEYVLNGDQWQPVAEASTLSNLDSVIFHK